MKMMMQHKFVEFIPEDVQQGMLYVSVEYGTAVHKCCCGCGEEVVTPLTPTDWKLTFDGATVSLHPSIGNWSFRCRSHYVIKRNNILWCGDWNGKQVLAGKEADFEQKKEYFEDRQSKARSFIAQSLSKLRSFFR
tara:strand:+ start:25652 stop:26056 length:405 start_codon:yes stop_codon:yes gene_type:complete